MKRIEKQLEVLNVDDVKSRIAKENKSYEFDKLADAINHMLDRIRSDQKVIREGKDALDYSLFYDSLTGMPNREGAIVKLKEKLAENPQQCIGFYGLDLDRFKFVNDTFGRPVGDLLIVRVGRRLRKEFGSDALYARLGGDKFLIVCDLQDETEQEAYARRIKDIFRKPFDLQGREVAVGVSIGASLFPRDSRTVEFLLEGAEMSMYRAKTIGTDLFTPYQKEFQTMMQERVNIEGKLSKAIVEGCGEFRAYLQPKLSVDSKKIESCEALIRWKTKDGVKSPGYFIPYAEESGQIVELTWFMIREVCRIAKRLELEGQVNKVSVNVPGSVLLREEFFAILQDALEENQLEPSRLDVEITETTFIKDTHMFNDALSQLARMGIEVSADDFGTGYSSLSYLSSLEIDRIKIDQSFIAKIGADGETEEIIKAIITMGKNLNMIITAEGIETKEQLGFLKNAACDEIQGYYISSPLPEEEYISFLKSWNNGENRKANY